MKGKRKRKRKREKVKNSGEIGMIASEATLSYHSRINKCTQQVVAELKGAPKIGVGELTRALANVHGSLADGSNRHT